MPSADSLKDRLRPIVHGVRDRKNAALYGACAVLLYHRVVELETDPQQLAVDPTNFDTHLSILKEKYRVLTVEEFDHHLLSKKKFPKNAVLLTFDDGYADNHLHARPILEKHGIQALFYIASGYMGASREYWWDEVERLLLVNEGAPTEWHFERNGFELNWRSSEELQSRTYLRALEDLRAIPSQDRDAVLRELRVVLKSEAPRPTHLPMTREELRTFAGSSSVVIGAHTVGHPSLARLRAEEQRQEIEGSKRDLQDMLGIEVPYFSYPFGTGADFNDTTVALAEAAEFTHVAANYPGFVHARSPQFQFPRFLVRNWDGPTFAEQLKGFFNG